MGPSAALLTIDFARRDVLAQYRASFLGPVWIFLNPALTLLIYTVVFSGVLGVRLSGKAGFVDYAMSLSAGFLMYHFFSRIILDAPGLIAGHSYYVKKVIFPAQTLVWSKVLVELVSLLAGLAVLFALFWVRDGALPMTAWSLPFLLAPGVCFAAGVAFLFSAAGVYFPDLKELVKPFLQVLFYLSPIIYPISLLPERARFWVWLNPVTWMTVPARDALTLGVLPDGGSFAVFCLCALAVMGLGLYVFSKARPGFSDVL